MLLRQDTTKPLFPALLWSKPEHHSTAGKLLIIGGQAYTFSAPAEAYSAAVEAGIGSAHVILPDSLKKITGHILEEVTFAPSTPSGSFSKLALEPWLTESLWADGVLLAGDIGRNSETAIVVEQFLQKFSGQVTLTKDAIDFIMKHRNAADRPQTTLVCNIGQLQKIAIHSGFIKPFTLGMGQQQLAEALAEFTSKHPAHIITNHHGSTYVAVAGQVSATPTNTEESLWQTNTAAHAAVWWLQNPNKPFEALTTSLVES